MTPRAATVWIVSVLSLSFLGVLPASGQAPREDAIWARVASGPITLDGVLNEPSWALAESMVLKFGVDNGIPGSGWKIESGMLPRDSTEATLKFLVVGNQLYLGAEVPDSSIGGSVEFNRFDGFLMAIKDHSDPFFPKPPAEYFYSWWYAESTDPQPPGQDPGFVGRWAEWPPGTPRTPEQITNWDAVTVVQGLSNSDASPDQGYTVEMRFNLTPMGYDVTRPSGDIVEWNISIYDCDWFWPIDGLKFTSYRAWWQGPWGNAMWYNEVRIHSRPDVTVSSGPAPEIGPELTLLEFGGPAPVIDGDLSESVWSMLLPHTFDIRFGDSGLRDTYEGVGPYRAGQYQPTVNGGEAAVLDPADATVKMFFMGHTLYLGFDVRDKVVQYVADFNRWDGFLVTINDRVQRGNDQQLLGQRISFQVAQDGSALPQDYLVTLVGQGDAEVALQLKPGTTVDTLGQSADTGYTAELAIDLTAFGYPADLGDGSLFIGVNHLDGDSFTPWTNSYGTRTWWYREYESECCPVWAHMKRTATTAVEPDLPQTNGFVLAGSFPNPARAQSIRYVLPEPSKVTLHVFDISGRLVRERVLGLQGKGTKEVGFDGTGLSSGLYLYRLTMRAPQTGAVQARLNGRMMLLN